MSETTERRSITDRRADDRGTGRREYDLVRVHEDFCTDPGCVRYREAVAELESAAATAAHFDHDNGNLVWSAEQGWHDGPRVRVAVDGNGHIVTDA